MTVYVKGIPLEIPGGPPGPDGNPVGTIISFMGTSAPDGYLICDGQVYNKTEYPALFDHFASSFGSSSYFGGDGVTTFAVPDMRNLFLRGYHGDSEALSGDIGSKQEGTQHVNVVGRGMPMGATIGLWGEPQDDNPYFPSSVDKYINGGYKTYYGSGFSVDEYSFDSPSKSEKYTSRPDNMGVLFCIKAVRSLSSSYSNGDIQIDDTLVTSDSGVLGVATPVRGVTKSEFSALPESKKNGLVIITDEPSSGCTESVDYSTDEKAIGTWVDGKTLYQKTFIGNFVNGTTLLSGIETMASIQGILYNDEGDNYSFPYKYSSSTAQLKRSGNSFVMTISSNLAGWPYIITVQYTKVYG